MVLPEPSSRAGVMAFKGGGMRTLVRAHDEVPCITAIITPEIRRRISASLSTACQDGMQSRRMGTLKESPATEVHPAVWGLSKRVRQPRPTQPHGPHCPKEETCIPAQHARMACNPALSAVLGLERGSTAYHKLSTLSPISLHYPSNKQPEPARGEFRLLL